MNNKIVIIPTADEINDQYSVAVGSTIRAVEQWIGLGTMLTEKKNSMKHGEWIPWVEGNLSFGRMQSAKYMRLANETREFHFEPQSFNEAMRLLSAPDEPEPELELELEPEDEPEYRNDPEIERALVTAKEKAKQAKDTLSAMEREVKSKELELKKLRKLKADKEKVEKALADLHELEKRKQELFADAASTKLVQQVLVRGREFFTKECMQIPALKLRPESVEAMKQDFAGLIELVENWLDAMKERFT